MSRLWSPVDLLSGQPSVSSRGSDTNSIRESSKSRKSLPVDDNPFRRLTIPDGSRSSTDLPPAAHSSNHTSISSSGRHHVITDTRHFGKRSGPEQQGILKKPRVRDYLGHRGSTGRPQVPDLSQYLNPARFSLPQPVGLPTHPSVGPKDSICDTISVAESSNDDANAPLDLCIKKPDSNSVRSSDNSDSRRSSVDSGEGPKKRGRKPKSLLAAATSNSSNATVTSNHPMLPLVTTASEVRPKKRGRPPLLSPPPNINVHNPVEEGLALMNRLFSQTLGQSTQLQPGWPTFSSSGQIIFPSGSKSNGSATESVGDHLLPSNSHFVQNRLQKPSDSDSDDDQEDPSRADLKAGLNAEDIRQPLKLGWKRHTIVKKIGSSGVRGEVLYFSPEGRRVRSHNDVSRYFTKYSVKNLRKENFSFSNKWLVGEFIEPTQDRKDHRIISESEIIKRIEDMRRVKRKKMGLKPTAKRGRPPRGSSEGSDAIIPEQRINQDLMNLAATARMNELKVLQMLQQAFAQTQNLEAEKQRQEEEAQRKADEAKERELKRQKMELQKEQELQRRKELQMMAEIEKERRRQHMMLVRSLEVYKRQEERDRKREEMLAEKRLVQEKKMQKKRVEMELMKELRKPVDDMMLKDLKPLPVLNRIPGLKLPSKVFSELLMMFEFLNNFGETLGFDMDSLPTMNTLQLAVLNLDDAAEEELMSVLHHLLVCAVEDPGPAVNMTTIAGQKLKDAPVTNINVSEILKVYFQSFIHHRESAREGIEGKIVTVLSEGKPFLSLSAELKSQVLSFLCNELLCNQLIVKQVEENIESIANLRREKWLVDCDLRKFRGIKMKREMREKMEQAGKEGTNSEDVKDGVVENGDSEGKDQVLKAVDEDSDESGDESNVIPVNVPFIPPPIGALSSYGTNYSAAFDEEPGMNNDEIDKKLDKLNRQATLFTNKLNRAIHGLRVAPLGQDRYRRRYWLLPATGGVFVEGLESGEPEAAGENPWSLEDDDCDEVAEMKIENPVEEDEQANHSNIAEMKLENDVIKEDDASACINHPQETNGENMEVTDELQQPVTNCSSSEKVVNGSSTVPFPLQGIESQLPVKSSKPWFSLLPRIPCSETMVDPLKPVANGEVERESEMDTTEPERDFKSTSLPFLTDLSTLTSSIEDLGDICPALQRQFTKQKEEQFDIPKKIPGKYQLGWWRITDPSQLRALNEALHERGVRERNLSKHIIKHLSGIAQKCKCDAVELEITDLDRLICEGCPFGAPQPSENDFSPEVALRVDITVLQQIEDLEEKIATSSMQVRGWKQSARLASDPSFSFEYKSASELKDLDEKERGEGEEEEDVTTESTSNNPVVLGRERLLTTEAAIERRYLKPPLGFKSNTILLPTGAVDELAENAADENASSGLLRWREAVRECVTGSQLALLLHFLESCIAWDKSIMRASCQFCGGGENEEQLLLCDGCDKGYHMYCFKPKMDTIPEGDWFCFECQNKNTIDKICVVCGKKGKLLSCDTCPKVYHPNCVDPPVSKPPKGKWSCHMCKKSPKKASGRKTATSAAAAAASSAADEKATKESPLKESFTGSSNTPTSKESVGSTSKKSSSKKTSKSEKVAEESSKKVRRSKENKESVALSACQVILSEMEKHSDSWPFQKPVNTKQFPTYKKIIKQPMDLASMKSKFESGTYKAKTEFHADVELMFNNCETFNEDESPVGQAGHTLKAFFEKRWNELVEKK